MIRTVARILTPYLLEMDPVWTMASFAVAALVWTAQKKNGSAHPAAIGFTMLWLCLCLVYTSTVLSRTPDAGRGLALMPLWSYGEWLQGNDVFLTYIVLNILMLLPIGVALYPIYGLKRTVLLGFAFSCFIECSQLLTGRGLFEIDDILHNTLGVWLGCMGRGAVRRWRAGTNGK